MKRSYADRFAATPPNVTFVVCVSPVPVSTTGVPTGPLGGLKLVTVGVTRNAVLLVSVVAPVVTVTFPVKAPAGTVALMKVLSRVVEAAATPSNFTTEALLKPWPKISILAPCLPVLGVKLANGPRPTSLKIVPQLSGGGPPALQSPMPPKRVDP